VGADLGGEPVVSSGTASAFSQRLPFDRVTHTVSPMQSAFDVQLPSAIRTDFGGSTCDVGLEDNHMGTTTIAAKMPSGASSSHHTLG
jgi:hypothetical protein